MNSKLKYANFLFREGEYAKACEIYRSIKSEFDIIQAAVDFNVSLCNYKLDLSKKYTFQRSLLLEEKKPAVSYVVYTVLVGDYESVKEPEVVDPHARYLLFTDNTNLTSEKWEVVLLDTLGLSPRHASRLPKLLPHRYLPEHEVSLYIDASLRIKTPNIAKLAECYLKESDIAAYHHFERQCVYDEVVECVKKQKIDNIVAEAFTLSLKAEGFPNNLSLLENAFLLRRSSPEMLTINENWYKAFAEGPARDQLHLMPTLWRSGISWCVIDDAPQFRKSPHTTFTPHTGAPEPALYLSGSKRTINWVIGGPSSKGWAYENNAKRLIEKMPEYDHLINSESKSDCVVYFDTLIHQKYPKEAKHIILRLGGPNPVRRVYGEDPVDVAKGLSAFDAIIPLSDELRILASGSSSLIRMIPNGVDFKRYKPKSKTVQSNEEFTLGFAANCKSDMERSFKGLDLVEEAVARIGVKIIILQKNKNQIPHERMVSDFYHKIDCIIHPVGPGKEGCSNVIMEALACGVPVITTRYSGYHGERLSHGDNVLFCERSVESIVQQIVNLRDNLALRSKLARNSIVFAKIHHDLNLIARQFNYVLRQVIASENMLLLHRPRLRIGILQMTIPKTDDTSVENLANQLSFLNGDITLFKAVDDCGMTEKKQGCTLVHCGKDFKYLRDVFGKHQKKANFDIIYAIDGLLSTSFALKLKEEFKVTVITQVYFYTSNVVSNNDNILKNDLDETLKKNLQKSDLVIFNTAQDFHSMHKLVSSTETPHILNSLNTSNSENSQGLSIIACRLYDIFLENTIFKIKSNYFKSSDHNKLSNAAEERSYMHSQSLLSTKDKKPNIVFTIAKPLYQGAGGSQKSICDIASMFAEDGYPTSIVFSEPKISRYSELPLGVSPRVKLINVQGWLESDNGQSDYKETEQHWGDAIQRAQPNILILWFVNKDSLALIYSSIKDSNIPIICSHRLDPNRGAFASQLVKEPDGSAAKIARSLISLARAHTIQMPSYKDFFPKNISDKVFLIPNVVHIPGDKDTKNIKPEKLIINVGRLHRQKNQSLLIKAFAKISKNYPDWVVEIYGEGPEAKKLQTLIEKEGMTDRIRLMGVTKEIESVYKRASLFAFPSVFEGFSRAHGEAMSHGLPSIALNMCDSSNFLVSSSDSGYLTDNSVEDYSEKLSIMLDNPEQLKLMGFKAQAFISKFDEKSIFLEWKKLVHSVHSDESDAIDTKVQKLPHIVFTIGAFKTYVGGAEKSLCELASFLADSGYLVTIIMSEEGVSELAPPFYPLNEKVNLYNLHPWLEENIDKSVKKDASWLQKRATEAVLLLKPDLLICFTMEKSLLYAEAVRATKTPYVIAHRNDPFKKFKDQLAKSKNKRSFIDAIYKSWDRAVVQLIQLEPYRDFFPKDIQSRVITIPNVVMPVKETEQTQSIKESKVILNVARLRPQKNQQLLIRAFAQIANDFPDWQVHIYGEGPERARLQRLIDDLGLPKQVFLMGTSQRMDEVYRNAAVFAFPSTFEGFSRAHGEAMAHGLPSIGLRQCVSSKILIGESGSGMLTENDVVEYSDALHKLLSDYAVRQKFRISALRYTERYFPQHVFSKWKNVVESLLIVKKY